AHASSSPRPAALSRRILTRDDLDAFQSSPAHASILSFVELLAESVRNCAVSDVEVEECAAPVRALLDMLDLLDAWMADFAPETGGQSRFGNPSFRGWLGRVRERAPELVRSLGVPAGRLADEAAEYLENSFGNIQRIDYGTGHELHFLLFLYCLHASGFVDARQYGAQLVLLVFRRYVLLMRSLQSVYWLEPAGSHGVWGLDDYHFLPFLFGASQLSDHPRIRPKSIHSAEILDGFSRAYLYLDMVRHANATKIGAPSLRWHSPLLDDISGVPNWRKVSEGLARMYAAEVLGKLPIVQHLLFGAALPFDSPSSAAGEPALLARFDGDCGHAHVHAMGQEAPECCNMRVPSAAAGLAAARERER
ncbi:Phosphotyrosyl phosphatase activator, partial [Hyaloraphidium curvatum]